MTDMNVNDHSVIDIIRDEVGEDELLAFMIRGKPSENKNEDKLLASLIRGKLPQQYPVADESSIFRVPNKLLKHNEKAFIPNLVSIGPYHHGEKKLQAMEDIKRWYMHCLLQRKPTPESSLECFVKKIRSIEQSCRDCYEEKFDLSSDEFVEIMVIDGCFIIEFLRTSTVSASTKDGPVFNAWMFSTLRNDLLLLENQLPWIVLDCLFSLTRKEDDRFSLPHITSLFFYESTIQPINNRRELTGSRHLLDTVRNIMVGSSPEINQDIDNYWTSIPSVTELLEVGIKIKRAQSKDMLEITFKNGVMEIPPIIIRQNGESLFRNLIAYEQCVPGLNKCHIVSYVMLFRYLTKSTKDVDCLIQEGIIRTKLSKEYTACLFNRLCNDTEANFFFFSQLTWKVDRYYQRCWLRIWLRIKQDYLYNPASIWSVSNAVIVILTLAFMQTIYSVLAYYK